MAEGGQRACAPPPEAHTRASALSAVAGRVWAMRKGAMPPMVAPAPVVPRCVLRAPSSGPSLSSD